MSITPETYEAVMECYGYRCYNCCAKADDLHHRLPKYKRHIDKFPLFIHSPINLIPICKSCHINECQQYKITEREAEMFEEYLRSIK